MNLVLIFHKLYLYSYTLLFTVTILIKVKQMLYKSLLWDGSGSIINTNICPTKFNNYMVDCQLLTVCLLGYYFHNEKAHQTP